MTTSPVARAPASSSIGAWASARHRRAHVTTSTATGRVRAGVDEGRGDGLHTSRSPSTSSTSSSRHVVDAGDAWCPVTPTTVSSAISASTDPSSPTRWRTMRRVSSVAIGRRSRLRERTSPASSAGTPSRARPRGTWVSSRSSALTDSLRCQPSSPPPSPAQRRSESTGAGRWCRSTSRGGGARPVRSPWRRRHPVEGRQFGTVVKHELLLDLLGIRSHGSSFPQISVPIVTRPRADPSSWRRRGTSATA